MQFKKLIFGEIDAVAEEFSKNFLEEFPEKGLEEFSNKFLKQFLEKQNIKFSVGIFRGIPGGSLEFPKEFSEHFQNEFPHDFLKN